MDKFVVKTKRKISSDANPHEDVKPLKRKRGDSLRLCIKELDHSSGDKPTLLKPMHSSEIEDGTSFVEKKDLKWRKIKAENLNCDYCILFGKNTADQLLKQCEAELEYNAAHLAQVKIFGRWHNIARKQVAHGSSGLQYTFSGKTLSAKPWTPLLENIRDQIAVATGHAFNFVLINRYKDGTDHIGEHRDDEKELEFGCPIASLTLGQSRDFVFKHWQARGKNATRKIAPVTVLLEHGGLLMMNHPTNTYWYHSLPVRKKAPGVRINMTFRKMNKLALKHHELPVTASS